MYFYWVRSYLIGIWELEIFPFLYQSIKVWCLSNLLLLFSIWGSHHEPYKGTALLLNVHLSMMKLIILSNVNYAICSYCISLTSFWIMTQDHLLRNCSSRFYFQIHFFQYYDLAADVLAENASLTFKFLTPVCTFFFSSSIFLM